MFIFAKSKYKQGNKSNYNTVNQGLYDLSLSIATNLFEIAEILNGMGIQATVLRLLTVAPLPVHHIITMLSDNPHVIVVEEVASGCGIREALAWELHHLKADIRIDGLDLGHRFITHGDMKSLYHHYKLDAPSIAAFVKEVCTS